MKARYPLGHRGLRGLSQAVLKLQRLGGSASLVLDLGAGSVGGVADMKGNRVKLEKAWDLRQSQVKSGPGRGHRELAECGHSTGSNLGRSPRGFS